MSKAIFKYNSGNGAILCNKCYTIIKTLSDFTDLELKAMKGEISLSAMYCDKCIKFRPKITRYNDFVNAYNNIILHEDNLKYIRKGQALMNYLAEVWYDEYKRISSLNYYDNDDIDCYYNDELINNTLNHLKNVWKNFNN